MTRSTRAAAGAFALFAVIALAGCSTPPLATPTDGSGPVTSSDVIGKAAWLDGGNAAAVVSLGSSTCVPKTGEVIGSGQTITANFAKLPADRPCTMDIVPRASYIPIPEGIDQHQTVYILANGGLSGTVNLPALVGAGTSTEHAPSAGWFEGNHTMEGVPDGSFAFLTYGSSSCAPTVESVTGTGASAVTLTLTVPADVPCTMDMAPRVGFAVVPDTVTGSDVTVTFEGAGITGTTQMLGSR